MLESYIIVGLTIATVEIIKTVKYFKAKRGKLIIPILVFLIAGGFNVLNAWIFGGMALIVALKGGLELGAVSGGLYSMGQTYLNKGDEK
jgi:hypothetical protein